MRKLLLSIAMLVVTACVCGQNYQMFYSDYDYLYAYPNGELTGLKFDSVRTMQDTVLYPFHNIRYDFSGCSSPFGNSWVGEKIIISPGGDHLLVNAESDTILIKAQEEPGVSWMAFAAGDRLVTATILGIANVTFLDLTDTVKSIGFSVTDSQSNPVDCPLNDMTLEISKSHGMITGPMFNYFPDLPVYAWEVQEMSALELAGHTNGTAQHGIQNLSWFEVHDFQPGDRIHLTNEESCWDYYDDEYYGFYDYRKIRKKYLERVDYPDSIVYTIEREGKKDYRYFDSISITFFHDTVTEVIRENTYFDLYPGEVYIENRSADDRTAYVVTMNSGDPDTKTMPSSWGMIWQWSDDESCWDNCCIDGCNFHRSFYRGLGGPFGGCGNFGCFGGRDIKLVYYEKGSETWGIPLDWTAVDHPPADPGISVYPNPAHGYIIVQSDRVPPESVSIYDLSGKLHLREYCRSTTHRIDLGAFSPDIYILSVKSAEGTRREKIIVDYH